LRDKGWSLIPSFIFTFLIVLPIWLLVLLPLTIVWNILAFLLGQKICGKKKELIDFDHVQTDKLIKKILMICNPPKKFEEKEYDLILFGATGFAGCLGAEYLAKKYGNTIKWAIAGRNRKKLET